MIALATFALAAVLGSPPAGPAPSDDAVVARARTPAGERTVTVGRVRAYRAGHPGASAREAAEALLTLELLAAEAEARGLDATPDVRRAVAEAAIPLYLTRSFEAEVSAAAIPRDLLQRAYEHNLGFYRHPELRVADHVLVAAPGLKHPDTPELAAAARRLLEAFAAELAAHPAADAADFRARGEKLQAAAQAEGLQVRVESLPRFARRGIYDPVFSAATFDIPAPGGLSSVVETPFGLHLIRLDSVEAPIDQSLDDAAPDLRRRLLTEYRVMELRRRLDAALEAAGSAVNPGLLGGREGEP